jgi:hypothetical protein
MIERYTETQAGVMAAELRGLTGEASRGGGGGGELAGARVSPTNE